MEVIIQGERKKKKRHEGAMMELLGGHSIFFSFFRGAFPEGRSPQIWMFCPRCRFFHATIFTTFPHTISKLADFSATRGTQNAI